MTSTPPTPDGDDDDLTSGTDDGADDVTDGEDDHDGRGRRLPFRGGEVRLLTTLVSTLDAMVRDGTDPSLARLHPPAHVEDPEHEAAWQLLARTELDDRRAEAHLVVERSLARGRATDDELHAWLTTLNEVRLVLGTQLGVDDDHAEHDLDGPDGDRWAVYEWLGGALDWVVRALSEQV